MLPYVFQKSSLNLLWLLTALVCGGCSHGTPVADELAANGRWDEAVAAYREAAKISPLDDRIQSRLEQAKTFAAQRHYSTGRQLLEDKRPSDALLEFKLALGFDPLRTEYRLAVTDLLRQKEALDQIQTGDKLLDLGRRDEALLAYERAVDLDPTLARAAEKITAATKQLGAEKLVRQSGQPITLRFQNTKLKEVFEILARTVGLNIVFDKELHDDPITIFIKDLPFDEALKLILNTNQLSAQRVGADTLIILPDNKQKQAHFQDLMVRTFYLSFAKAKDAVNVIKTMLESKRVYVDEKVNALMIRDEPAKLSLAERMLYAIDRPEPEVELGLEVLEVNRTKSLKYGLNFAKQIGAGLVPPGTTGGSLSTAPTTFTFQQLASLGPESYLFTFPASILADFFKQDSDAKTLASPKIRVLNNKSASISVGDKQPILLSTTNVLPGQAATGAVPTTSTVTSIEFKDTGVKLTVEPTIHLLNEITLKLKVEVTRLGDQVTLQASPEIKQFRFGTRSAETILSIKDDETIVLAGLIQNDERKTRSGTPGLSDIPWLGQLFTSTTQDTVETEVVLTITPHILRALSTPSTTTQAYWSGTENTFATTQLFPVSATPIALSPIASPMATSPAQVRSLNLLQPSPSEPSRNASSAPGSVLPPQPSVIGQLERFPSTPSLAGSLPPFSSSATPESVASAAVVPQSPSPGSTETAAGFLMLRHNDLSVSIGQEVRLELMADQVSSLPETLLTVRFNRQGLEFRSVIPGTASITARDGGEQLVLNLQTAGPMAAAGLPLASLLFVAKAPGDFPITLHSGGPPGTGAPAIKMGHAVIRVR